ILVATAHRPAARSGAGAPSAAPGACRLPWFARAPATTAATRFVCRAPARMVPPMRPYRPSPHRRRAPGLLSAGVLVSAFAFAACNAAPGSGSAPGRTHGGAPLWAARGISDAHPDLAWLHAVGSAPVEGDEADARARAELDARGKIMRNLVSKVRAEV